MIDVFSANLIAKPLTSDKYCVRGCGDFGTTNLEFDWSPNSNNIVFAFSPSLGFDYFHLDSSLATVNLVTGVTTPWERKEMFEAMPRYSPNGKTVAYMSSDSVQRYAINRRVALRSAEGNFLNILAPTFNEGAFIAGPSLLGWSKNSENILFFEPKGTKFHLVFLPVDGSPAKQLETGDCFLKNPF